MFLGDGGNRKASFALIVGSESAKKLNCDQFVYIKQTDHNQFFFISMQDKKAI